MKRVLMIVVLCCTGCASTAQLAAQRGSREFSCPEEELKVTYLSYRADFDIYRVEGCGQVDNFACRGMTEECVAE